MTRPYVIRMRPHLVQKVWGGRSLADWGKELPPAAPFGESWEVADLPQGQSRIDNGPFEGRTLGEAVKAWGRELIGTKTTDEVFPLLVKILDAKDDLSVQVHPGPEDVKRLPGAHSKDEAWLILDSQRGSILHGFQGEVGETEFRRAVEERRAEEVLRRIDVAAGEIYRVAPGTVHAICAGVQLLEVQQPSDTTYRVWDYDRPGLDGKPRPLHLEQAYSVMKYEASPVPTAHLGDRACESLIETPTYSLACWELRPGTHQWTFDTTSPTVVFALEGEATVEGCRIERGETAVIPAVIENVAVEGSGRVVIARA